MSILVPWIPFYYFLSDIPRVFLLVFELAVVSSPSELVPTVVMWLVMRELVLVVAQGLKPLGGAIEGVGDGRVYIVFNILSICFNPCIIIPRIFSLSIASTRSIPYTTHNQSICSQYEVHTKNIQPVYSQYEVYILSVLFINVSRADLYVYMCTYVYMSNIFLAIANINLSNRFTTQ